MAPDDALIACAARIADGPCDLTLVAAALGPRRISAWPDLAWRDSRLTGDGFPAEFALSSSDRRLRCTIDSAPPELPESGRLHLAAGLAGADLDDRGRSWLAGTVRRQAGRRLRWGAWLGLRQHGGRLRPKLYAEVRESAAGPVGGRLTMTAFDTATGTVEDYYHLPPLDWNQLRRLAGDGAGAQFAALAACLPVPVAVALGWIGMGASVAAGRVTLYLRPAAMPGIAERVAERFRGVRPAVAAAGMLGIGEDGALRLGISARMWLAHGVAGGGSSIEGNRRGECRAVTRSVW